MPINFKKTTETIVGIMWEDKPYPVVEPCTNSSFRKAHIPKSFSFLREKEETLWHIFIFHRDKAKK